MQTKQPWGLERHFKSKNYYYSYIYIYIYICGVMIIKPGQLEHKDELLTFNPDKSTDFNIVLERLCPLKV